MSDKFKVKYQVSDGYVGKDRPLHFNIDSSDIEDDMDDDDFLDLYTDMIQSNFENNVFPEGENASEFIEWARGVRDSR